MPRNLDSITPANDILPHLLRTLDLAALADVTPVNKEFAIARLAPLGEVTLFTGPGGAGKSLLGQQFATAAAAGKACLGLSMRAGSAIYLTCEDDADQLHWRQAHLCKAMDVPMASLAGKLHLVSLRGELDNPLTVEAAAGRMATSQSYQRIAATIEASGAALVILDNVAHLFSGNENDRGEVTRFVNLLNKLAGETGAAILLLGHPNKAGDNYSGSTAWLNAVRSQITLDHDRDDEGNICDHDARVLTIGKANYDRKGEALRFRWHDWAFVREDDLSPSKRAELAEMALANTDNEAFMRCLDERNRQERPVSESPASRTYAPKVFSEMAESKKIGRPRLEAAMDRLFRTNAIERGFLFRDASEGKDRHGLRRASADLSADLPLTGSADVPMTTRRPPPAHTLYTTYIEEAGLKAAAPSQSDDDVALSATTFSVGQDDGLGSDGNIIGWNEE